MKYVQVDFTRGGTMYTYKYNYDIRIGDWMVVKVGREYKVVNVRGVYLSNPTTFPDSKLKWAVCRVDIEQYEETIFRDEHAKQRLSELENIAKARQAIAEVRKFLTGEEAQEYDSLKEER